MKIYSISKQDTTLIKGLAIFFIILHNFFHKLEPTPGENEFSFDLERIQLLFQQIGEQPFDIINLLFSFLGHYGVQIFIFISGFGLALSWKSNTWGEFIGHRLKKLYPLLLMGIIVFLLSFSLFHTNILSPNDWRQVLYKLLFIHTLLPLEGTELVGPWWFFGLIFQLYLLFPILYKCILKYGWKALAVICFISYSWIFISQNYFKVLWSISLMQNAPGHIMEFCFGIWFALNKERNLHWIWLCISLILFALGNIYLPFYPALCMSVTIIFVFAFPYLKAFCQKIACIGTFFSYLGSISMLLFATHAIFRMPFVTVAEKMQIATWGLIEAVIFLIVSIGVALASKPLYEALSNLFAKISIPEKWQKSIGRVFMIICIGFFSYVFFYYTISALKPFNETSLEPSLVNTEITLSEKETFADIATIPISRHANALWVHYTFDYYSENGADAPSVILSIKNILWRDLNMTTSVNEDGSIHYVTSYLFYSSFLHKLKGSDINLYYWNNNNRAGIVKNVKTFVSTK